MTTGCVTVTEREVDCLEGFRIKGAKISPRGRAEMYAPVQIDGGPRHKTYRVWRRADDGHTLYAHGRLVSARVLEFSDGGTIVVFIPESYDAMRRRVLEGHNDNSTERAR
jgi:hypothetical protein